MEASEKPTTTRCVFVGCNHQPMWIQDTPEQAMEEEEDTVFVKMRFASICDSDIMATKGIDDSKINLLLLIKHVNIFYRQTNRKNAVSFGTRGRGRGGI